jgi:hypothetical protein
MEKNPILNDDGTVTYWCHESEIWEKVAYVSIKELILMSKKDQRAVTEHLEKNWTEYHL